MERLLPHLVGRMAVTVTAVSALLLRPLLAGPIEQGAAEAKAFAPALTVDPSTLGTLDAAGNAVLFPGTAKATTITPEQLFPGSSGDVSPFTQVYGDQPAMIELGHRHQNALEAASSPAAKAYQTLIEGRGYSTLPDLSADPFLETTRRTLANVAGLQAEFGGCTSELETLPVSDSAHLPDLKVCERIRNVPIRGAGCAVVHTVGIDSKRVRVNLAVGIGKKSTTIHFNLADGSYSGGGGDGFAWWSDITAQPELQSGEGVIAGISLEKGGPYPWSYEIDPTFSLNWRQVPSSANGYAGTVEFVDDGKDTHNEQYAAHVIYTIHTLTRDAWSTGDCLTEAERILAGVQCIGTVRPLGLDSGGCAVFGGARICPGHPFYDRLTPAPAPLSGVIPRNAAGAIIEGTCVDYPCFIEDGTVHCPWKSAAEFVQPCKVNEDNPACSFQSSRCVEDSRGSDGQCRMFAETWDCGFDVGIDTVVPKKTLICDSEIRCLGNDCVDVEPEVNTSFAEAAATLKAAQMIALDTDCDPATGSCVIFTGKDQECKKAFGGAGEFEVDCCADPKGGVSLADYLTLTFAAAQLGGTLSAMHPDDPLRGAWEGLTGPATEAWDWVSSGYTSVLNSVTGTTTAASPEQAASLLGSAQTALMEQTAQWTLDAFGPEAVNLLFTVAADGSPAAVGGTLATEPLAFGGGAAWIGSAMGWIGAAYTAYQVAVTMVHILWTCEQEEFELGMNRQLKQTHFLGIYCAKDTPLGCVEQRRSYCAFASPLSRILQEQIRPQLGIGWGDEEDPDCRGLSVAELAAVDWQRVDLSEWVAILAATNQLPKAETLTQDLLTGAQRAINVAHPEKSRPNVTERTIERARNVPFRATQEGIATEFVPLARPGLTAPPVTHPDQ